jgi:hypothetical protein
MRSPLSIYSDMKARQSAKIRELWQALVKAGIGTLDKQAGVLGLSGSTTWAVLMSGVSAGLIKRLFASPQLPPSARTVLIEYVEENSAGICGHSQRRLSSFRAQRGQLANVDRCSAESC